MDRRVKRLNYTRICIEVDAEGEFPKSMELEMDDRNIAEVSMKYSWLPKRCGVCKEFGHVTKDYKKGLNVEKKSKPNAVPHLDETWREVKRHGKAVVVDLDRPNIGEDGSDKPRSNSGLASSSHNLDGQSCSEHVELCAVKTAVAPEIHGAKSPLVNNKQIVIAPSSSVSTAPRSRTRSITREEDRDSKNSFSPLVDLGHEDIDRNLVTNENEIVTPIKVDPGGNSDVTTKTTPFDASATLCLNRLAEKVINIDEVERNGLTKGMKWRDDDARINYVRTLGRRKEVRGVPAPPSIPPFDSFS